MNYLTRDLTTEALRRSHSPAHDRHGKLIMSLAQIDLVQKYAAWLHNKNFTEELNRANAQFGLPPRGIPVFLKRAEAKLVYDALVREIRRETGAVLLRDAEFREVLKALTKRRCEMSR